MNVENQQSSGVQELIDRLRDEGVAKGRDEADALVAEARKRAADILEQARREADKILAETREEAERTRKAGEEALRLACRDAVLTLRESLGEAFTRRVRRLVSHTLQDQEFLRRLILEIARRAVPEDAEKVEVLLPENVVTAEELQRTPEEAAEGTLSHFVLGLAGDILREGLTFHVAGDDTPGVRLRLADDDVEIELTDETISALLMRHLVPRFRAIMERQAK